MDDKINSEQEIEERFDIPILGVIPNVALTGSEKGSYSGSYGYQQSYERSAVNNEKQ